MKWNGLSATYTHKCIGVRVCVRMYEYSTECWAGDKLISATKGSKNIINVMNSHWRRTFQKWSNNGNCIYKGMSQGARYGLTFNTHIYVAYAFFSEGFIKQISKVRHYTKVFFFRSPQKPGQNSLLFECACLIVLLKTQLAYGITAWKCDIPNYVHLIFGLTILFNVLMTSNTVWNFPNFTRSVALGIRKF